MIGKDTSFEPYSKYFKKLLKHSEDDDGVKIEFENLVEKLTVEIRHADFVHSTQSVHADYIDITNDFTI